MRLLYELAARTDCANQRRLENMTVFIDPSRNPDGRDNNTRTSAYAFDPNRDLAFQTQDVNREALDFAAQYPGLPTALSKPITKYKTATTSPPMNWLLDPAPATRVRRTVNPRLLLRINLKPEN